MTFGGIAGIPTGDDLAAVSERAARPEADFAAQVAEAQRQLAESIARAGLNRDAYRHLLEAHVVALAVLPAFVAEVEAKRQPWTKDERRAAALDFVARLDQRIAQRMVQFNLWAMVGIAVALPVLCGGSFLGGWPEQTKCADLTDETV